MERLTQKSGPASVFENNTGGARVRKVDPRSVYTLEELTNTTIVSRGLQWGRDRLRAMELQIGYVVDGVEIAVDEEFERELARVVTENLFYNKILKGLFPIGLFQKDSTGTPLDPLRPHQSYLMRSLMRALGVLKMQQESSNFNTVLDWFNTYIVQLLTQAKASDIDAIATLETLISEMRSGTGLPQNFTGNQDLDFQMIEDEMAYDSSKVSPSPIAISSHYGNFVFCTKETPELTWGWQTTHPPDYDGQTLGRWTGQSPWDSHTRSEYERDPNVYVHVFDASLAPSSVFLIPAPARSLVRGYSTFTQALTSWGHAIKQNESEFVGLTRPIESLKNMEGMLARGPSVTTNERMGGGTAAEQDRRERAYKNIRQQVLNLVGGSRPDIGRIQERLQSGQRAHQTYTIFGPRLDPEIRVVEGDTATRMMVVDAGYNVGFHRDAKPPSDLMTLNEKNRQDTAMVMGIPLPILRMEDTSHLTAKHQASELYSDDLRDFDASLRGDVEALIAGFWTSQLKIFFQDQYKNLQWRRNVWFDSVRAQVQTIDFGFNGVLSNVLVDAAAAAEDGKDRDIINQLEKVQNVEKLVEILGGMIGDTLYGEDTMFILRGLWETCNMYLDIDKRLRTAKIRAKGTIVAIWKKNVMSVKTEEDPILRMALEFGADPKEVIGLQMSKAGYSDKNIARIVGSIKPSEPAEGSSPKKRKTN